ncbi:unannotated protein [freshwater metagenome]|uniref:Unannotated protein n=1 Tax=freshwater metagenome TaxID=449393 RepID=A0A6J7L7K6_9ZZZZ
MRTFFAISIATCSETAVCFFKSDLKIESWDILISSLYAITPPKNTLDDPGTLVSCSAIPPAVIDSATDKVLFNLVSRLITDFVITN